MAPCRNCFESLDPISYLASKRYAVKSVYDFHTAKWCRVSQFHSSDPVLSALSSVICPYFNPHFCPKSLSTAQLLTSESADDDIHTDCTEPGGRGSLD